MHVSVRATATAVAVAVFTFLFGLVAAPLLSLAPTGAAYAQEGPKIEIEFDPHYLIRDNEALDFTLTFSGISGQTGLTYDVNVATLGEPEVSVCEDADAGVKDGIELGVFTGDTATATGTIPAACPAQKYALVVKLRNNGGDELVTVARPFKISPFMKLVLPGDDKPTSPAGLWAEETNDGSGIRFHVVDSGSNRVYMYDLGELDGNFTTDRVTFVDSYDLDGPDNPWGITSDSDTTWVSNDGSTDEVFAYSNADRSQRVNDDEFTLDAANSAPRGVADYRFNDDVRMIYVVDNSADKIFYYLRDRQYGSSTSTFTHTPENDYVLDEENTGPAGLWLNGWSMYVSDSDADKVFAYVMEHDGDTNRAVRKPELDIDDLALVGNSDPAGITTGYIWVFVLDSVDRAIYAYEQPDVPYEPVTIHGISEITVAENSTTTGKTYHAMDPNMASGTRSQVGLFRTLTDDRIFKLQHLGSDGPPTVYGDFELAFWDSPEDCSRNPNYEEPRDTDGDNVYDLILSGGTRSFPNAYFPVTVEITNIEHEDPCFVGDSTDRYIPESADFGYTINPAVRAIARDEDPNIYSVSGTDAAEFEINSNGYLVKNSTTTLDHDTKDSYSVTVNVRDDEDENGSPSTSTDDSIDVTIRVIEAPVITGANSTTFAENGTGAVQTFTATSGAGLPLTWHVEGHDGNDFTIASTTDGGTLRFLKPPDFERPTGHGGSNVYVISVVVSDGYQKVGHDFTVTVTNVNDPRPSGTGRARLETLTREPQPDSRLVRRSPPRTRTGIPLTRSPTPWTAQMLVPSISARQPARY